jgi:hypothetical protein
VPRLSSCLQYLPEIQPPSLTPFAVPGKRPAISSQLIDNLNASIHPRALLTDLFLLDEILKLRRA